MIKKILLTIAILFCLIPLATAYADEGNLIIIKRSSNDLAYYENGKMVKTFKISANRSQQQSPVGIYKVVLKKEKPSYLAERIPGGHPNNPLGSYWLGINYSNTDGKVYGIHGTNKSSIIGSYTDKGNFSMRNEDIRWLYNRVNEGTKVAITNSSESFSTIYRKVTGNNAVGDPRTSNISLVIDGVLQNPPQKPIIKNGRTFVPFRFIFEKIGADVKWVSSERRVIATKGDKRLQLVIDSKIARFNGVNEEIDAAPFVQNGHTYVPIRYIFKSFDQKVTWDQETRTVHVSKMKDDPFLFYINDVSQPKSIIDRIQIIYNDKNNDSEDTVIDDLLVPSKYLFEKFGAQTTFLPNEKKLIISRNEQNAELIADSKQIKINGYRELLENAPTIKNGEMLVPLEVAVKLFGAERIVDNSFDIKTIDLNFILKKFSKIYFNGNARLPYTGFIVDNVHYLPLGLIFIELDAHIKTADGKYDNVNDESSIFISDTEMSDEEIEIYRDGILIQMHIDSHSAFVNGKLVYIPHPPKYVDGQYVVPLDFVINTLGLRVNVAGNVIDIYE